MASYTWNDERDLGKIRSSIDEDDTLATAYDGAKVGQGKEGPTEAGNEKRLRFGLSGIDYGRVATALWRVWLASAVTALVVINLIQPRFPAELQSLMSSMQQGPPAGFPFIGGNPGAQGSPLGGGFPALGGLPSGTFGPFANSR